MSQGRDDLGDRMKMYELKEAGRKFMPLLPIIARLDGKNFSRLTKNLERPYDERFSRLMVYVTSQLIENTHAFIGYTQSDEISLVYYSPNIKSQIYFDGRISKLTSVLASMATFHFNTNLINYLPEFIGSGRGGLFDCRVWQVPTKAEAVNAILWRELDATKNSISTAARHYYSHQQLHGLTGAVMLDMLIEKGINWNDYPTFFKRGTYIQKRLVSRKFTSEELERLPEQHEAHETTNLEVTRSEIVELEMPPLSKVTNRIEVIFNGEVPITIENYEEIPSVLL